MRWAWKSNMREKLLNNERLARVRLAHLNKKLARDHYLQSRYNEAMWKSGIVEEVPVSEVVNRTTPVFYMPHRPVAKEARLTTKVRPVFDAPTTGYNGVSLNSCINTGPNLLANVTEILIRFRRWKIAITADIEKAFLQVGVKKEDCDVHRFLWTFQSEDKIMRFRRVPFGNSSSPFLLNATIKHHLTTVPQSHVTQELNENLYVDDLLSGTDSD